MDGDCIGCGRQARLTPALPQAFSDFRGDDVRADAGRDLVGQSGETRLELLLIFDGVPVRHLECRYGAGEHSFKLFAFGCDGRRALTNG
jgi:hypothetical protein